MAKKPAQQQDWHRADIKASLEKSGWNMAQLSCANGYGRDSIRIALRTPWPKAETIIAAAIGVSPQTIWPTRYRPDGSPKSRRHERGIGRAKPRQVSPIPGKQYSGCADGCNVNVEEAA